MKTSRFLLARNPYVHPQSPFTNPDVPPYPPWKMFALRLRPYAFWGSLFVGGVYVIYNYHDDISIWIDDRMPRQKDNLEATRARAEYELTRTLERREYWAFFNTRPYGAWRTQLHTQKYMADQFKHYDKSSYQDLQEILEKERKEILQLNEKPK